MSQFEKSMRDIFDAAPIAESNITEYDYIPKEKDNSELTTLLSHDLRNDYDIVRDTISNVIEKGMLAAEDMLAIARQSEKARDFEVASNMLQQIVDNSKELLDIQKQMRDMTNQKESSTTNIKNAVFVGSTTELLKAMKELKNQDS